MFEMEREIQQIIAQKKEKKEGGWEKGRGGEAGKERECARACVRVCLYQLMVAHIFDDDGSCHEGHVVPPPPGVEAEHLKLPLQKKTAEFCPKKFGWKGRKSPKSPKCL